jgi:hypothetical protein
LLNVYFNEICLEIELRRWALPHPNPPLAKVGLIHPFERKTESPILSLAAETHSNGGIRSLNFVFSE